MKNKEFNNLQMTMDIKVPMSDGVTLSTNVYLPKNNIPCPVILQRSPYGTNTEDMVKEAINFVKEGYGVVLQDVRGRWDSDGEWYPFINEAKDGYETQEWIGSQDWCDGNIGTIGASYLAMAQWQTAALNSKYLKAMAPKVSYSNFYHDWVYTGGAFQLAFNLRWIGIQMNTRTNQLQYLWMPKENHLNEIMKHLPLIEMDSKAGRSSKPWKEWIEHPTYDNYWKDLNPIEENYEKISVPVLGISAWYDIFLQGTLNNYIGVKSKGISPGKDNQKLLIGPWMHFFNGQEQIIGDIDFGEKVKIDIFKEMLNWFDFWLKGKNSDFKNEDPVKMFLMGKNEWQSYSDWPIPDTKYKNFYIHSKGNANSSSGDGILNELIPNDNENFDTYKYDPANPVPTIGGTGPAGGPVVSPVSAGPKNQFEVEKRKDILVYTTPPLKNNIQITGPVKMILFASSNCIDTDFTCKLVDVYPNGFCLNIAQGIIRARYRNSWENPEFLNPNEIYKYDIDMWSTSNFFHKDHKIRIEISSSNFPQFDRNPNTGNQFGMDKDLKTATQKVYHDKNYPSHIILPCIK
tara:strand:- start:977 stop:2692 length:1716 start_codon:yes stop_codon:yes gene_type:complete